MTDLRWYQAEAIEGIYSWFQANATGNPLVVVPTGGGKSVIMSEFVRGVLAESPNERILVVTHVKELIQQNHDALLRHWPEAPAGIYSAGLRKRQADARVLFCGIQTVYNKIDQIEWADLILIDEVHLVPAKGFGMYRTFLNDLKNRNPYVRMIGFTATPFRTDTGRLDRGEDRMFHGQAYSCDIVRLIQEGYLSPVVAKGTQARIDTTGVHLRGGEFIESELQAAAMDGDNVPRAVEETIRRAGNRRSWLVFACGVKHAERVVEEFQSRGIETGYVLGSTSHGDRDETLRRFKRGEIQCLVNVGVLTTGFDAPMVDLIVLLRPTMSPGLYVQMVGRGLRTAPGKTDCLVLDFGDNVLRHGPIDHVKVKEPGEKGDGTPPARECPQCATLVGISAKVCPECGFEFAILAPERGKHGDKPAEADIIQGLAADPFQRWQVSGVSYRRWVKEGKPHPTLRVEYHCGLAQNVSEWICLEHAEGSWAQRKAAQWWIDRGGRVPVPVDINEALLRQGELDEPVEVVVRTTDKYPELRSVKCERQPGADDARPVVAQDSAEIDYSELPF